jgi:hypothetical protein
MSYTSAEVKLRTLALANATMQADLGGSNPSQFRWYNSQLLQNTIASIVAKGAAVTVNRVSVMRPNNQSGIAFFTQIRFQVDVYSLDSENARTVAEDVIQFIAGVDLCSLSQFQSPPTQPVAGASVLLNQRQRMLPNPASPSGPIWTESMDFRVLNLENLSFS